MHTTIETRLNLNKEQEEVISSSMYIWSSYYRKTWVLYNNQKLNDSDLYQELKKYDLFTSYQINSLRNKVKKDHSRIKELTKSNLKNAQEKLKNINKLIKNTENELLLLGSNVKNISYSTNLIKTKKSNLYHKKIKETRLIKLVKSLESRIKSNKFKLCFGSSVLLSQRPGNNKNKLIRNQNPYKSIENWKKDWDLYRNNIWISIGEAKKPQGNPEMQYNPQTNQLKIRLLEAHVNKNLSSIAEQLNIPLQELQTKKDRKLGSLRTNAKNLTIDNVFFHPKQLIKLNSALDNNEPITVQIVKKLSPKNEIGYYLQIIFEEQTIPQIKLSKVPKTMGIDLNQKGIAYCIVKEDGNKLKNGFGFIKWDLENKSTEQRSYIISNSITEALKIAQEKGIFAISVENLDFRKTINNINSVFKGNKKYNKIITQFSSIKFKNLLIRKAKKLGITISLVNPSYSSIGGYSKYGTVNKLPIDISASFWLARQAIYGLEYKVEENTRYIKKFEESLSLPYIIQLKQSKKLNYIENTWKDIGLELGKDRKLWYKNTFALIKKLSSFGTSLLQKEINPFEDPLDIVEGFVEGQAQEYKELGRSIKLTSAK